MCFILFLSQFIRLIGINCPFYVTNLYLKLTNELVAILSFYLQNLFVVIGKMIKFNWKQNKRGLDVWKVTSMVKRSRVSQWWKGKKKGESLKGYSADYVKYCGQNFISQRITSSAQSLGESLEGFMVVASCQLAWLLFLSLS